MENIMQSRTNNTNTYTTAAHNNHKVGHACPFVHTTQEWNESTFGNLNINTMTDLFLECIEALAVFMLLFLHCLFK